MTDAEQPVSANQEAAVSGGSAPVEVPKATGNVPQQEQMPLAPPEEKIELHVSGPAAEPPAPVEPMSDKPLSADGAKPKPEETKADEPAAVRQGEPQRGAEKMSAATIIGIVIVLIAVLVLVFYATRKPAAETVGVDGQPVKVSDSKEQGKVNIIEETKNNINVLVDNDDKPAYPRVRITAYLANTQKNPGSADCSLTYPLEREIDKKYDSNMINTMIGLLEPLSALEKEQGYVSVIPGGTLLKYLKLDDSGVMSVNLTGNISQAAGSCAVTAIKAQITDTISQFAAVKSVVICIDGNCQEDEILQP